MNFFYLKNIRIINILIIEFFLITINESNTIKFKIKTLKFYENNLNINELYKENYFYYDFIFNNIYCSIKIGFPPQNIVGFISGQLNEFNIVHEKCFVNNSKYNRTNSKTFNNLTSFNINHKNFKHGCFAEEDFKFELFIDYNINEKKEINFPKLKFFLADDYKINDKFNKNEINSCAIIGLKLNNKDLFKETPKNFIYYLMEYFSKIKNKQYNNNYYFLNNFYWTIKYNIENNDYFSIGEPPHIYDPENYKTKKFIEFNIESDSSLYWNVQFSEIFINKNAFNISNEIKLESIYLKKYSEAHNCLFYPEINSFFATIEYFNLIKKEFFNKFFSNNICSEKKIFINSYKLTVLDNMGGEFKFIFCNKNKIGEYGEDKFYLEFPSLNFYHKLLNKTFIFNGKELFFDDKNENIYFLICVKNNVVDQWIFGKIFMKKYQVIFNSEMKTIGFYLDNENKNNFDDNPKRTNKYIIIFLVVALSFIISIILLNKYKKVFLKNKKIFVKELEMINKNEKFI